METGDPCRLKEDGISLLVSIVIGNDTMSILKSSRRHLKQMEQNLKFEYRACDSGCETKSNCTHGCYCWYENEYFEYIDNNAPGNVNLVRFDTVLRRMRNGKCEHVEERRTEVYPKSLVNDLHGVLITRETQVSYLHAVAAVGNIKLVKYLCKEYPDYPGLRTPSGLVALHVAVLKQHVNVLKYLSKKRVLVLKGRETRKQNKSKALPMNLYFNWNEFESDCVSDGAQSIDIYTRSKENVIKVDLTCPLLALLKTVEHPKLELLIECSKYLEDKHVRKLVIHLLIGGNENDAIYLFKRNPKRISSLSLKVACILSDSNRFLATLIDAGEDVCLPKLRCSLIDLATCVESSKCLDFLFRQQVNKRNTGSEESKVQPYYTVFYYGALTMVDIEREFILGFLNKVQKKGFDINKIDFSGLTPLHHVLLNQQIYSSHAVIRSVFWQNEDRTIPPNIRFDFVKRMLELGANIDALDLYDRTPLFAFMLDNMMGPVDSTRNTGLEQIIRLLLYFNSNPKLNENVLYYCHQYEKKNYDFSIVRNEPLDGSMFSNSKDEILHITLSKSPFAVLFELGFGMHPAYTLEIDERVKQMWPVFYLCVYTQPRSLMSLCRLAVRSSNPGIKLFKFLGFHHLPVSVRKYLLCETLLDLNNTKLCE